MKLKPLLQLTNTKINALSSVAAILVGLIVGLIIMLLSNASQAFQAFGTILTGGFSSMKHLGDVLYFATPIILTGLSVGFAARTGLFNIGAAGQFIVGAFAAIFVGVKFTFLPGHLHWICALLAAIFAGALWGAIPGLFKALFNVNEVIACIMTNYIGTYFVKDFLIRIIYDSRQSRTMTVAPAANLPKMGMDKLFKDGFIISSANSGIFVAILFSILIYFILDKTSFGYELKACGFNREAARYAGINEKRSIILSMTIAGALAGLGGALLYLAGSGMGITLTFELSQQGFLGIPVALLGLNNPIGIIFSGLLIAYLNVGGSLMQLYKFAPQVIEIIIGVIIYFSAFALLVREFLGSMKKRMETPSAPAGRSIREVS